MTFKYKFWSKIVVPIDYITRLFGYYIIFSYIEEQTDVFDRFSKFKICYHSKLDQLNK